MATRQVSSTEVLDDFYQRQVRVYDARQQALEHLTPSKETDQEGTCGTRFVKTTCDAVKRCAWTDTSARPWRLFRWLGMSTERKQASEHKAGVCRLSDAWLNRLFEELDAFGTREFYSLVHQGDAASARVDSVLYPFGMHTTAYRRVLARSELDLQLACDPDTEAWAQWLEIQQFTLPELSRADIEGVLRELELERAMSTANGVPSRLAAGAWLDLSPGASIWVCDAGSWP
jgi:hypothetical protein